MVFNVARCLVSGRCLSVCLHQCIEFDRDLQAQCLQLPRSKSNACLGLLKCQIKTTMMTELAALQMAMGDVGP